MDTVFKLFAGFLVSLLVASCTHVKLENRAKQVNVYYSFTEKAGCSYIGDAVGSDGNILTFLFISNRKLTEGALNDLKNNARAMGGDTVYIIQNQLLYTTSTTFVGSVYNCAD